MSPKSIIILSVLTVVVLVGQQSLYTIKESERGVKLRFGEVISADLQPGLGFKLPVVHEIRRFEARNQVFDMDVGKYRVLYNEAPVSVDVDSYVIWRVKDVKKYYTDTSGEADRAHYLVGSQVEAGLRDKFGALSLEEVVSGKREELTRELTAEITKKTEEQLGIEVVDIKVKKVELPESITETVYKNMQAERKKKADLERATGSKTAEGIRAAADRTVTVTLANAYEEAEKVRGAGDAEAAAIYAKAFGRDTEFYDFTRSLKAYETAFSSKQDVLLLSPSSDFFRYITNLD